MTDRPFISIELDRRIAVAQRARDAGQRDARGANRALMPWAAAEAWIAGHDGQHGISPRPPHHSASDLCPLDATIAELTRARDSLAQKIEQQASATPEPDRIARWHGIADALRSLHRLHALREAFRQKSTAPDHFSTARKIATPSLPPAQPSLLADMFGPDGMPLPIERNAA